MGALAQRGGGALGEDTAANPEVAGEGSGRRQEGRRLAMIIRGIDGGSQAWRSRREGE